MTQKQRLIISCFLGNLLEWFEFAMFGFLLKQISMQFFPKDADASFILTYGIFAVGFVMRPVGGIICGYLGDKFGRKTGLMTSISLMAIPTFAISILPTYSDVGILAPILLMICRLLQGVSLGGEFSGSIVYLIEHAPKEQRARWGAFADLGSSVGMILATLTTLALNAFLTEEQLLLWGWRLPFVFGIVFGYIGYNVRRRLLESPEFLAIPKRRENPIKQSFIESPIKFVLAITFLAINSSGYYFLLMYLPQGQSPIIISFLQLSSLFIMMPSNFYGAYLADKIGQVPVMISGIIAACILTLPLLFVSLSGFLAAQFILQALFSVSLGFCFGPRSSFIVQAFNPEIRYSGVSITYNLANALFGGTAPMVCALLVQWTGSKITPGFFIISMSLISLISVLLLRERIVGTTLCAPIMCAKKQRCPSES